jgi:hypothetical protein
MKLKNRISVANKMSPLFIAYSYLGALIVGTVTLVYFNTNSSHSYATDHPKNSQAQSTVNVSAKDYRILQNGTPIHPVMGIAVNTSAVFDLQVRSGIDLKKEKNKPLAAEISILRGATKVTSLKFENVAEMKTKNLQEWINQQFQPGDKLCIELQNTVLSPNDAMKVYTLATAY